MNAKETKEWNSIFAPAVRLHIQETMPPPVNDDEVVRWFEAALKRQGLRGANEWGGTAQALAEVLYKQLDILWGFEKAPVQPEGEEKVSDPENVATENESAVPESFPAFPESPVVVFPSTQPGLLFELPDGTTMNFSVTMRQGGTAEMALELIGQFLALFTQYGVKPNPATLVMKPQTAPPPPFVPPTKPPSVPPVAAQPAKSAGVSPFSQAQPSAPANEAADPRGNVPGEMKVNPVEFITFNDSNGKKSIELWIKGMEFPVRVDRADQMGQVVDFLTQSGLMDFSTPPQLGAKYPLSGVRVNRLVGTNKTKAGNYYLNFHSLEVGGASESRSDLPF